MQLLLQGHLEFGEVRTYVSSEMLRIDLPLIADRVTLLLFDYYLPGEEPLKLVSDVLAAHPSIIAVCVSASHNPADRDKALAAGACLVVNKNLDADVLVAHLRALLRDEPLPSPSNDMSGMRLNLTPRQIQVLTLLGEGYTNKEMARLLGVSPETVKRHVADLLRRTQTQNRLQIVSWAMANGFVAPSQHGAGPSPPVVGGRPDKP
jgi:DNA-binding NarL/FixJ family response regulator